MKKMINISLSLIILTVLFSCVSSKKYKSAVAQAEQLQAQNTELNSQISALQKQVTDANDKTKAITSEFNSYKTECQDCQQRLEAVRSTLNEMARTMDEVQSKLTVALENFKEHGVEVYSKDGIIYVSLEEGLLYKSGSAKLDQKGKDALGQLATVLNDYPKLQVIVVGNTDTVHVKGVADNWTLSTERANGVVRLLSGAYSVDPARLVSAGQGKFHPVADNSSAEGRAKNRRTDIILNPDLERIWKETKEHK